MISLVASELAVSGNLTIMNGHALQGGGISMDNSSTLALQEPLVANNIADQGSAIYAKPNNNTKRVSPIQVWPANEYSLSNITLIDISVHFSNNSDGKINRSFYAPLFSLFGYQLSPNLLFDNNTWDPEHSQYVYTTLIDSILHMDDIDKYTSLSNGFCIQPHQQDWKCDYFDRIFHWGGWLPTLCSASLLGSRIIYPGQTAFSIHYLDINQRLDNGYCYKSFIFDSFEPYKYSSVIRDDSTLTYKVPYPPEITSYLYYTIVFTDADVGILRLPILHFQIADCPPGFSLSMRNETCVCDSKLAVYGYTCDIDTISPPGYWTGQEQQENSDAQVLFGRHCHPNYCDSDKHDFHLTDDPAEACLGNRTGVLCGECKENYSVVFGSDTCYDHCTNVYLLTILAYALAGLLLVLLLFALRITVATGAINGLVLYANVLGLVLDKLTEDRVQNSNYVAFVRVFISLLNLDLGFPLCFYEGMTTAGKVGFQFLFPVYLWSIVVILVLLSKCSVRLSELISKSSVQVLVTLFYLSFSKLLSTIIVIFSTSAISVIKGPDNYTSRLVWYYDGHDYGSSTHAVLIALAVAFTVLFLLPYALLVTFSSLLLRFRIVNKFKPFIDAYGGPFKDKWRFWFGLRVWITILLFGLNSALQGTNTDVMFIVIIITVTLFIYLQSLARPFKNRFIGALDLSFMVNYLLLVIGVFWAAGVFWWIYILTTAIAALTTTMIVIGHVIALSGTCRAKCENVQLQYKRRNDYQYHEVMQDDEDMEDMELFAAAEDRIVDTY